jgi:deazaflavin-dependent oxidoreductase (nitroreductase family)
MGLEVTPRGTHGRKLSRTALVLFSLMPPLYHALGGLGMGSTLILSTIGAKSGRRRDVHLTAFDWGVGWLVVASRGGDARHPAWFLNMVAHPSEIWVQKGETRMQVRAQTLKGAERAAAWHLIVGTHTHYGDYAQKTDRVFPIVHLSPVEVVKVVQLAPALVRGVVLGGS